MYGRRVWWWLCKRLASTHQQDVILGAGHPHADVLQELRSDVVVHDVCLYLQDELLSHQACGGLGRLYHP
jgi:hypothetical protein